MEGEAALCKTYRSGASGATGSFASEQPLDGPHTPGRTPSTEDSARFVCPGTHEVTDKSRLNLVLNQDTHENRNIASSITRTLVLPLLITTPLVWLDINRMRLAVMPSTRSRTIG